MKLAVLGGSFDPIHLGHLAITEDALDRFGYDRAVLVPAFISPLKRGAEAAPAEARLAMLNAAVRGNPRLSVDDCELRRGGVSYTVDTIRDLHARYAPDGRIGFIIGEDLIAGFPSWSRVDELLGMVDILLATRSREDDSSFPYPHRRLDNPPLALSSTTVRQQLAAGRSCRYVVPDGALDVIAERGLYGTRRLGPKSLRRVIADVETAACRELTTGRYLHSRSVAVLSARLCVRFGLDPERGYLAGIAHDIAKELPVSELRLLAAADGASAEELEQARSSVLHSRAGARLLASRFGEAGSDLLDAVRQHTLGAPGMCGLAKIVYIADKIEPTRPDVDAALRACLPGAGLDELFLRTVEDTVRYLRAVDGPISPVTEQLLESLKESGL